MYAGHRDCYDHDHDLVDLEDDSVVTALVQRLAEPNRHDSKVSRQLDRYKRLVPRWQDWGLVTTMCNTLAREVLQGGEL